MYKNLPPIEMYGMIKNIYGKCRISVQHVKKWYRKFKSDCEIIVDESYLGRPISVVDKILENQTDTIIQCDRKARLFDIAYQVICGIWYCSEYRYKKNEISKNMGSLDTAYADYQTVYCIEAP